MASKSQLLMFSFFYFWGVAVLAAGAEKQFNETVELSGIGFVRVVHRIPGEPMMLPDRFEIWVRCHREKKETLIESLSICGVTSHEIDKKAKLVNLSYLTGRTDPSDGATHCDIPEYREFKLASVCKKKKR